MNCKLKDQNLKMSDYNLVNFFFLIRTYHFPSKKLGLGTSEGCGAIMV